MLRFRSRRLAAALALSTAISAGGALAQPVSPLSPADSPVVVTPTNGLVTIESDLQKADNSTGVVTATGNVRIV